MKYKFILIAIAVIVFCSLLIGCANREAYVFYEDEASDKNIEPIDTDDIDLLQDDIVEKTTTIYIDICGAVRYPGVYLLNKDARLFEAVEAAGGLTQDASSEAINQAELLSDGQKIYIMNRVEWEQKKEADSGNDLETLIDDGLININSATESELCTLPGIGATRAKAIKEYREKNGGFSTIEEIQKVPGIKNGTYDKISNMIKIK